MGYVYTRGRKLYIGYVDATGKTKQKATGCTVGQEDLANDVLRQVEAAIAARQEIQADDGTLTLARYVTTWIEARRKRGVETVDDDKSRLDNHVLPTLGAMELEEVRPRHIRALMDNLAHGELAPRTQSNVLATVRALFRDAVADELLRATPVVLKRHEAPSRKDADPRWRVTALFDIDELQRIVRVETTPLDRRVLYALMGLGGLRFGEASALRWGDLSESRPLRRLWVAGSYSTKKKSEKETKTESPRGVPVIPELDTLLAQWKEKGWSDMLSTSRQPTDSDLLIPSRRGANRSVNHMLKKLRQDLDRLKMRPRRQHDFRRTFTSLCRAGGATEDLLRFITHGPSPSVMDAYTTLPWVSLCDQVHGLHLQLTYSRANVLKVQEEKWRGGRDSNVYARDEQHAASESIRAQAPDNSTSCSGEAERHGGQVVAFDVGKRQAVSTVSEAARTLLAACDGSLDAAVAALHLAAGATRKGGAL